MIDSLALLPFPATTSAPGEAGEGGPALSDSDSGPKVGREDTVSSGVCKGNADEQLTNGAEQEKWAGTCPFHAPPAGMAVQALCCLTTHLLGTSLQIEMKAPLLNFVISFGEEAPECLP